MPADLLETDAEIQQMALGFWNSTELSVGVQNVAPVPISEEPQERLCKGGTISDWSHALKKTNTSNISFCLYDALCIV